MLHCETDVIGITVVLGCVHHVGCHPETSVPVIELSIYSSRMTSKQIGSACNLCLPGAPGLGGGPSAARRQKLLCPQTVQSPTIRLQENAQLWCSHAGAPSGLGIVLVIQGKGGLYGNASWS